MESGRHKHLKIITICFFMSGITLPMITHFYGLFDTGYISSIENRYPHQRPSLPRTLNDFQNYFQKMSNYFDDHFGFRKQLIHAQSYFNYLIGVSSSKRVMIGKDGWLFLTDEDMVPQYTGAMNFSKDGLRHWIEAMEERGAWLKSKGIPFFVAIPPNKMTVYPEYLPDGIHKLPVPTRLEQLESAAQTFKNFTFLSLKPEMAAAKEETALYYKTDSHWNHHGAFLGYRCIMGRIVKDFPDIVPLKESDVSLTWETSYGQDLSRLLDLPHQFPDVNADTLSVKKPSHVIARRPLNPPKPFPQIVRTDRKGKPVVLVYRDSYTDAMQPLLDETFGTVIYAEYDWMVLDKRLIDEYKPDLVLHIMVERMLRYSPDNTDLHRHAPVLAIKNWGPRQVKRGMRFNEQPNGLSALWVIGEKVNRDMVIVWNDHPLKTEVDIGTRTLTAFIPDSYYETPGKYSIHLQDARTGEKTEPVYFTVMP